MLAAIGILAGKKLYEKFAYFVYAFAIWDIFYYIFLKLTLNWPPSFLTWDVLFLIPWAWVGPVITPITCSILLVIMALLIIRFQDKGKEISISSLEWCLFILGMILTLYTWLSDYSRLIFTGNPEVYKLISTYIPTDYNWILFYVGILLVVVGITAFYERERKSKH